jgi:hypothetical protein
MRCVRGGSEDADAHQVWSLAEQNHRNDQKNKHEHCETDEAVAGLRTLAGFAPYAPGKAAEAARALLGLGLCGRGLRRATDRREESLRSRRLRECRVRTRFLGTVLGLKLEWKDNGDAVARVRLLARNLASAT